MLYDPKKELALTTEPWRLVLLDAADDIERRGLAKFMTQDDMGRHCMWGAILNAVASEEAMLEAWERINAACDGNAIGYNNAPERTAAEVVATLRSTAGAA